MKKIILISIALLSVSNFAKKEDYRETVRVTGSTAQVAFDKAQDMVVEIKSTKGKVKLPYLKECNLKNSADSRDAFWFKRNAWTNSSSVYLNHVTGVYTAIVNVSCKQ